MLIVDKNILSFQEGHLAYFRGELFSGGALFLDNNGVVVQKEQYIDGVQLGEYVSPYIRNYPICINSNRLIWKPDGYPRHYQGKFIENDLLYYQDQLFTGIAYVFCEGICIVEQEYDDGMQNDVVKYDQSGQLILLEVDNQGVIQKYKKLKNGKYEVYEIWTQTASIDLMFEENGAIRAIFIDGDYFAKLPTFQHLVYFNVFTQKDMLLDFIAGPYFCVSGEDIDDELIANFVDGGKLEYTHKVHLRGKRITIASVQEMLNVPLLRELVLKYVNITEAELAPLRKMLPNCNIRLVTGPQPICF